MNEDFPIHLNWISTICKRIKGCECEIQKYPLLSLTFCQPIRFLENIPEIPEELSMNDLCTGVPYAMIMNAIEEIKPKSYENYELFQTILNKISQLGYEDVDDLSQEDLIQGDEESHILLCRILEQIVIDRSLTLDIVTKDLKRLPRSFFILERRPESLEEALSLWFSKYPISDTIPMVSTNDFEDDILSGQHIAFVLSRVFPNDIAKYDVNVGPSLNDSMADHNWELIKSIAERLNMFVPPREAMDECLLYNFLSDVFYATRNDVKEYAQPTEPPEMPDVQTAAAIPSDSDKKQKPQIIPRNPRNNIKLNEDDESSKEKEQESEQSSQEDEESSEKKPQKKKKKSKQRESSSSDSDSYNKYKYRGPTHDFGATTSALPNIKGPLVQIIYKSHNKDNRKIKKGNKKTVKEESKSSKDDSVHANTSPQPVIPPMSMSFPSPLPTLPALNNEFDEEVMRFNEEAARFTREAERFAQQTVLSRSVANVPLVQTIHEYVEEEEEDYIEEEYADSESEAPKSSSLKRNEDPELALCLKQLEKLEDDDITERDRSAMANALRRFFNLPKKDQDLEHLRELIAEQYPEDEDPAHIDHITSNLLKVMKKAIDSEESMPRLLISAASKLFGEKPEIKSRASQTREKRELGFANISSFDIEEEKRKLKNKRVQKVESSETLTQTDERFHLTQFSTIFETNEPLQVIPPRVIEINVFPFSKRFVRPYYYDTGNLSRTIKNFSVVQTLLEGTLLPGNKNFSRRKQIYEELEDHDGEHVIFLLNSAKKEYKGTYSYDENMQEARKCSGKGPLYIAFADVGQCLKYDIPSCTLSQTQKNGSADMDAICLKKTLEPQCW